MPVFYNVLDIAYLNVQNTEVLPMYNAGKSNRRRLFLLALGFALTESAMAIRQQIAAPSLAFTGGQPAKGRCHLCNWSADCKTQAKCKSCSKFLCATCSEQVVVAGCGCKKSDG